MAVLAFALPLPYLNHPLLPFHTHSNSIILSLLFSYNAYILFCWVNSKVRRNRITAWDLEECTRLTHWTWNLEANIFDIKNLMFFYVGFVDRCIQFTDTESSSFFVWLVINWPLGTMFWAECFIFVFHCFLQGTRNTIMVLNGLWLVGSFMSLVCIMQFKKVELW